MYYNESEDLISRNPSDENDLISMDRSIARSYAPTGMGWLDNGILCLRTGLARPRIVNLAARFKRKGILELYSPVECPIPCGEVYDPNEGQCPKCDQPASAANPTHENRYRVVRQPIEPVFDPLKAGGPYDVFISYRHHESRLLAGNIFYSLEQHGKKVFLDNSEIPPGTAFSSVFLPAASTTPLFVALVSRNYFDSDYCKKELAHALRSGRQVVLVDCQGGINPPKDMAWLNRMNPCSERGVTGGLTPELERILLSLAVNGPIAGGINDFRLDACTFLLRNLGDGELIQAVNSHQWLLRIAKGTSPDETIQAILREVGSDTNRILELCSSLSP